MNLTGKIGNALGVNLTVVSLSVARMADGIGNSILYVIIPLYVDKLPEKLIPLPKVFLIGILISAYGFATASLQPFMAALSDRIGRLDKKCRLTA
jgi:MFS family permease